MSRRGVVRPPADLGERSGVAPDDPVAAEALDLFERTVRRYLDADTPLPARRGPTGIAVTAGELLRWIEDVEEGERFGARRAS